MNAEVTETANLGPLVAYSLVVVGVITAMLGVSYLLGERRRDKATGEPFESGIVPVGDPHLRFSVHFYLLAIFFVIFDLEAIFIFAWAIAFRETGWAGYIEISIFIAVLLAALAYLWLNGALDWRTKRQRLVESRVER